MSVTYGPIPTEKSFDDIIVGYQLKPKQTKDDTGTNDTDTTPDSDNSNSDSLKQHRHRPAANSVSGVKHLLSPTNDQRAN